MHQPERKLMNRSALFSINPEHLANILTGKKVFEYRKVTPRHNISRIVFYCTAPVKKIVAVAEVVDRVIGSPTYVWNATSFASGVSRFYFRDYFSEHSKAIAYVLGNVYEMSTPMDLSDLTGHKLPPQSFYYLEEVDMNLISQCQQTAPSVPPSIIFVGGVHGVGKTSMCKSVFGPAGYQCLTASALIASQGKDTGKNKNVDHIEDNQNVLLQQLASAKVKYSRLLLDGHFTLINNQGNIEPIPAAVFDAIKPNKLFLIKGCPNEIASRIKKRDGEIWSEEFLSKFQAQEEKHAHYVSKRIGVPLRIIQNDIDLSMPVKLIKGMHS
jgi:predicted transcriptional regulator/adenylate kinase